MEENEVSLDQIVQTIKLDIIFGRLRPRERLIEDELTDRFQTSRHLVRRAFGELESLGIVTRRRNKGTIVRDFSTSEVEDMYETRAILQREAARRIPLPADRQLIDDLERIHAEYSAAIDAGDLQRVCTLNNQFHQRMFRACNNQYLAKMIDRVWVETLGIRCYAIGDPTLLRRSQQDHAAMIEKLRQGDRDELLRLVVDHIWPALEAYKRAHGGWSPLAESQTG
jgi:DNA-binding GntR family transcriptional regulator